MNYGFIGTGNMASAIIKGMINSKKAALSEIFAFDTDADKLRSFVEESGITPCTSNTDILNNAEFVILAVKPNVLESVLKEISDCIKDNTIISIAAGKSLSFIESVIGYNHPVVRVMPNVNALVGESMSALCRNNYVTDSQFSKIMDIFTAIGKTVVIDEKYFSIFVGISGSSPAYAYLFIDSIAHAGVKAGLDKKTSLEIAAQAVLGSAKTIIESGRHPWDLIDMVCSPGGATIEGIASLLESKFESAVMKAVEAVISKDKSL